MTSVIKVYVQTFLQMKLLKEENTRKQAEHMASTCRVTKFLRFYFLFLGLSWR